jgi:hypothetical protein
LEGAVRVTVAYYYGSLPLEVVTGDARDLPRDGVAWVVVQRDGYEQTLAGRDNFWVYGDSFGAFNDPENLAWYGGNPAEQAEAWRWTGRGSEHIDPTVPVGAVIFTGVMLPDDEWVSARGH